MDATLELRWAELQKSILLPSGSHELKTEDLSLVRIMGMYMSNGM